jgi:DmsE family decaheme c-type cytochrome
VQNVNRTHEGSNFRKTLVGRVLGRGRGIWSVLVLSVGFIACVTAWAPPARYYQRTADVENAGGLMGTKQCLACHKKVQGQAAAPEYHNDCEACHGPGELHWETKEPLDTRHPSNEDCAKCHETGQKTLMAWSTSQHARNEVLCTDCHNPHNREPNNIRKVKKAQQSILRHASDTTQMCSSCHPDVSASMNLPSHHPMGEGMLECSDCHAPHQDRSRTLGARTAMCTSCHQQQAGPFIFEHTPVAEDCSFCHTPHGSSAEALLDTNQPGTCITCHTVAESGAVHGPYAFVSRCTDCHGAIHGSFADPHLRQ